MSSTVMVPFRGDGAGVAEMSWGQREIWTAILAQENWQPIGGVGALPVPKNLDEVVAALSRSISRHQSLRTRVRCEPDGGARQVLSDHGEVPLDVVDVPDDGDPAQVAAELAERYRRDHFDYEHHWPIRMGVARRHGLVTHLAALYSHFALDGAGLAAVFRDGLISLFDGTTPTAGPPAGRTPFDQVEWQHGPAGRRHDQATRRHWRRLLARVPSRRFPDTADQRQPRHWQARFHSPAAHLAMRSVMARTGAESSAVLLAGAAVALVDVTRIEPAVLQVVVNNRFRPGLADSVGPIAQTGLCVIDTVGTPFHEVVDRARQSAMTAYLHAYYDPDAMTAMIADLGRERGAEIDIRCFLNDRRNLTDGQDNPIPDGASVTPHDVTEALAQTTLTWGPHSDTPFERLFVHVDDAPDSLELLCQADTRYLPPDHIRAFLNAFESTLVTAVAPYAGIQTE